MIIKQYFLIFINSVFFNFCSLHTICTDGIYSCAYEYGISHDGLLGLYR